MFHILLTISQHFFGGHPVVFVLFKADEAVEGSCGAMSGRPQSSMGSGILSLEEKKFLLAVERGDVASTRRL